MEFIDLCLPSGTKWMKCNIGASKETDYGLYFQWGATVGYSGYDAETHSSWATCPGIGDASLDDSIALAAWDAANLTDGVLNASVDAAYQATNGKAKMPTEEQFCELIANTISELVTIDGVKGYKFTSESNPSKYVFFPASDFFASGGKYYLGAFGYYWSSSVNLSCSNYAQYLGLDKNGVSMSTYGRCLAQSVRGVLI